MPIARTTRYAGTILDLCVDQTESTTVKKTHTRESRYRRSPLDPVDRGAIESYLECSQPGVDGSFKQQPIKGNDNASDANSGSPMAHLRQTVLRRSSQRTES